jgi:hypothetical protein
MGKYLSEAIKEIREVEQYEKYKDRVEPLVEYVIKKCRKENIPIDYFLNQFQKECNKYA